MSERSNTDYQLPRDDGEARRLRIQAELLREATEEVLAATGVRDAGACLDIGCGTGDAMRSIARLVARPAGRIVGLDLEVGPARAHFAELGAEGARYELVAGDMFDTSLPAGGPFELVFSRYLLHHIPDPVAALARMWDRVADGGTLAVIDIDQRGTTTYPLWWPYDELEGWIRALYVKLGIDNHIGHKLPNLFERAGIGAPDGSKVIGVIRPVPELAEFLPLLLDMIRGKLIAHDVASAADLARVEAGLATAAQQAGTYCYRPAAVGVWKRKTGAAGR